MQKITHTISLEDFKTRFPLTYPSVTNGQYSFVTKQSLNQFWKIFQIQEWIRMEHYNSNQLY